MQSAFPNSFICKRTLHIVVAFFVANKYSLYWKYVSFDNKLEFYGSATYK